MQFGNSHLISTTNKPKSQILPKIARIFRKITGQISVNMLSLPESTPNNLLNTNKLIAFLDASIANWESKALLPVQQRSQKIIRVAQTRLNIFVYGKEQVDARGNIAVNSDGLETQILNIPALIEAAINYFFGVGKDKKIGQGNSVVKPQNQLTDNRHFPNQDLALNSWLNFSDVFGNSGTLAKKPVSSPNLSESKPKSSSQLTRTSRNAVKSSENLNSQAITENHHNSQVEAKPDWIEVEATFVGYDKHPLEQLLEWLDHAILWLEEIIVKVYQFFQRLWRCK